jgi:hypothetical protein
VPTARESQNGDILQSPRRLGDLENALVAGSRRDRGLANGPGIGHPLRLRPDPAGPGPGDRPVRRP